MKKGQVTFEFMFFIGMGVLLFVIFAIISVNYLQDSYKQKQNINGQDLVDIIRNELNLAGRAENGYHREYQLPSDLGGLDYNIQIVTGAREVAIGTDNTDYVGKLSTDVTKDLSSCIPGKKLILTKEDGEVKLSCI
jgi:hypothetical protein